VGNAVAGTGDHVLDVDLADGETKSVTVDLRDTQPAHVRVRVMHNGSAVAGATVAADVNGSILPVDAKTGADGRADITCPSGLPVKLWVAGAGGLPLGATTPMTLGAGQHVEVEIALVEGTLEIRMPALTGTPEKGSLSIALTTSDGRRATLEARTQSVSGARDLEWSSDRIALGPVPPGDYAVEIVVRTLLGEAWQETSRLACNINVRADETAVAEPK
jgi:hypothetical protein